MDLVIRKDRCITTGVLEQMLAALNKLSQSMAIDGRQQVCRLGEGIAVHLLYIWKNKPSIRLKVTNYRTKMSL